jgi:hypothetical protein
VLHRRAHAAPLAYRANGGSLNGPRFKSLTLVFFLNSFFHPAHHTPRSRPYVMMKSELPGADDCND